MKILIINSHENSGGAARAAHRLYRGLCDIGVNCNMLVAYRESEDTNVRPLFKNKSLFVMKLRSRLDRLLTKFYPNRSQTLFSSNLVPLSGLAEKINELNPDIVHLHWVSGGMISISDICKIKQPIVWSLHDMWAFTGGCHYDEYCGRFRENCGFCKVLGSENENDLSSFVHNKKNRHFKEISNLTIVGLSSWISGLAKESSLFRTKNVITLPNPINIKVFEKCDSISARKKFSLPLDKKIILFGAMSSTSDPRKGFEQLKNALAFLPKNIGIELVVFGNDNTFEKSYLEDFKIHTVGIIENDEDLKTLYNCADVMVVPSIQENLSNAIVESLACETPVVAFNIGGNRDMIDHKINGYLAKPFDHKELADGIIWVLESDPLVVRSNARIKVEKDFCSTKILPKYVNLYQILLKGL